MLIKCPNCRSVYDLPDNLITDEGLKMRCAECKQIWTAYPEDALKKVSTSPKNIQKMFKHISEQTNTLFTDQPEETQTTIPPVEKVRNNIYHKKSHIPTIILFTFIISLILILLFTFRYEIVRFFPKMEQLYTKLNISSVYYGTNLEFNNISTKEFIEDNLAKIEISGMVTNNSKYEIKIPPVKIDIFDKSGKLLISITEILPLPRLESGYNILFSKTINNPTIQSKSIYVTFEDSK